MTATIIAVVIFVLMFALIILDKIPRHIITCPAEQQHF